jgi:type IV secretion system protein VirB6
MKNCILGIIYLVLATLSFADSNPKFNCANYSSYQDPSIDFDYLTSSTTYGVVLNAMSTVANCSKSQDQIQVYFQQSDSKTRLITFNKGDKKTLASLSNLFNNLPVYSAGDQIITDVYTYTQKLCVSMKTIYGIMPLICANDMYPATSNTSSSDANNLDPVQSCSKPNSCNFDPFGGESKTLFNFSGRMVQCVRETLDFMFFQQGPLCPSVHKVSSFTSIVSNLKVAIFALLMMYTIFYGIKILMDPYRAKLNEAVIFAVKMLLVIYFSIGFPFLDATSDGVTIGLQSGIIDIAVPLLTGMISDLSQIVLSAARTNVEGTGLCVFDPSLYNAEYSYYSLFDSIDCHIGYYMGWNFIADAIANGGNPDISASTIFSVIFGLLLTAPFVALVNIAFVYLFLNTLIVRFIGSYIVYFICLNVMLLISPIFIPMILFEKTKQMFQGWMRVTLSFALQPAIMVAFITMMITIYDDALFQDCVFQAGNKIGGFNTFTFSNSNGALCQSSYGYQMYNMISGQNWGKLNFMLFGIPVVHADQTYWPALLQALIIAFIMYKFAFYASEIAASITGGVSVNLASEGNSNKPKAGAQDKSSSGGGGAQDKSSSAGGGAMDKAK